MPALGAGAFVLVVLFVLTTFLPNPQAEAQARAQGFSDQEIQSGLQYTLERKLLWWGSTATTLVFWSLLVCTGLADWLANRCKRLVGDRWLAGVLLVGALCFLAQTALALPFGLLGLEQQRSWGMTARPLADWLVDFGKGVAVSAVVGGVVLVSLYLLLRYLPRWWWAVAAAGVVGLGVCFAWLVPVVIDPLFHDFHPLADARLRRQVEALAARAGVPVREVLVMDASRKGLHTNAYFTGFGPTRRIVLYDTLVASHTPEEIESILGHEIGHWQHHHIVKGILLGGVGALLGFFVLAQVLRWASGRRPFGLTGPADPASLPLVLLLLEVGTLLALPVQNAVSRHFERQADRAALELAGHPEAFIAAEKRLARDNIGNLAPNPLSVWIFASHPPVLERIQMAEDWRHK